MGTTQSGADWCLKALHPSDPLTEVRGIPDKSAVPSLLMNYQATMTIGPAAGATGTWSFDATLLPHPVDFMVCDVKDSAAPAGQYFNLLNPQIDGETHGDKFASLRTMAQRWRLAYMSVTAIQNGSSLANQGVLVSAQVPVQARKFAAVGNSLTSGTVNQPFVQYQASDKPVFEELQAMPSAYFNRSKEGCYMPLKLTDTCQKWSSDHNAVGIVTEAALPNALGQVAVPTTTNNAWPHESLAPVYSVVSSPAFGFRVVPTSAMLNGVFGHICGKGIDVATTFTFYIRCGIEMQVQPSSVLAPQLKLSPPHDPMALETYFAICRELKDGYPEIYNAQGKLWPLIQSVVHKVAPTVVGALAPALMPFVGGALSAFDFAGNSINERVQKRRGNDMPRNLATSPLVKAPSAATPRPRVKKNAKKSAGRRLVAYNTTLNRRV